MASTPLPPLVLLPRSPCKQKGKALDLGLPLRFANVGRNDKLELTTGGDPMDGSAEGTESVMAAACFHLLAVGCLTKQASVHAPSLRP